MGVCNETNSRHFTISKYPLLAAACNAVNPVLTAASLAKPNSSTSSFWHAFLKSLCRSGKSFEDAAAYKASSCACVGFCFGGGGGGGRGRGEFEEDAGAGVDIDVETRDNGPRSGEDCVVIAGEVAARLDGPTIKGFSGTGESTCMGSDGEGDDTGAGMGSASFSAPGK
jgi:hypothetical protein